MPNILWHPRALLGPHKTRGGRPWTERRRHEDRSAEGAEGVGFGEGSPPHWEWVWGGGYPRYPCHPVVPHMYALANFDDVLYWKFRLSYGESSYDCSRWVLYSWAMRFLADRTNGRAIATLLRLSSVCLSVVCDVMYCG